MIFLVKNIRIDFIHRKLIQVTNTISLNMSLYNQFCVECEKKTFQVKNIIKLVKFIYILIRIR